MVGPPNIGGPTESRKEYLVKQKNRGRTLWEMMTGVERPTTQENQHYNPFKLRVGDLITLSHLDHEEVFYEVRRLVVYHNRLASQNICHTHYELCAQGGEESVLRLQAVPIEREKSGLNVQATILYVHDEFGYNESLAEIVASDELLVLNGENEEESYSYEFEPQDESREPFNPTVTALADTDGDGFIDEDERERYNVHYWRYFRKLDNGMLERAIVQVNQSDGWTHLLVGPDVDVSDVNVFPRGN